MNLNPLKKDDNTDALVQALEDANNVGAMQPGVTPSAAPDDAAIAADPQVVSAGVSDGADISDAPAEPPVQEAVDTANSPLPAEPADPVAGINFDGNDIPVGLSSDADAHLTPEDTPTEGTGDNGELDDVKKSALEQLRPLIEKLDLEPADKFDKYLMMLRASDDPALIKPAFDAAQGIPGEKEKAQALLDIINEINYITANQQPA